MGWADSTDLIVAAAIVPELLPLCFQVLVLTRSCTYQSAHAAFHVYRIYYIDRNIYICHDLKYYTRTLCYNRRICAHVFAVFDTIINTYHPVNSLLLILKVIYLFFYYNSIVICGFDLIC